MTDVSAALADMANTRLGTVLFLAAPVLLIVAGTKLVRHAEPLPVGSPVATADARTSAG
jgi:hypothetical protein